MWLSNFSLNLFVAIPMAPINTGMIIHFSSTFVLSLYVNSFISFVLCSLLSDTSISWHCHVYQYACFFFLFFLNYYTWPICHNFSMCVCVCLLLDSTTLFHLHAQLLASACVYHFCVVSMLMLCILNNVNVHQLCHTKHSLFTKMGHPEGRWSIVSSCYLYNRHLLSCLPFKVFIFKIVYTNFPVLGFQCCTSCFCLDFSKF